MNSCVYICATTGMYCARILFAHTLLAQKSIGPLYLQFVQGDISQSAVDLGVIVSLCGVLQDGGAEGQGLEVVVFCHLILLQAVVDCGQSVVGCPLIHKHT